MPSEKEILQSIVETLEYGSDLPQWWAGVTFDNESETAQILTHPIATYTITIQRTY